MLADDGCQRGLCQHLKQGVLALPCGPQFGVDTTLEYFHAPQELFQVFLFCTVTRLVQARLDALLQRLDTLVQLLQIDRFAVRLGMLRMGFDGKDARGTRFALPGGRLLRRAWPFDGGLRRVLQDNGRG